MMDPASPPGPSCTMDSSIPESPPRAAVAERVSMTLSSRDMRTPCSTQKRWKPSPALKRYRWWSKKSRTLGEQSSVSFPRPSTCR